MFRYTSYFRMRWVSLVVGFLAVAAVLWFWSKSSYGMDIHHWAKLQHARAELWLASNLWGHAALGVVAFLCLWLGFSTILVLLPVLFFWPSWLGGGVILAIHLLLLWQKSRKMQKSLEKIYLPPDLQKNLPSLEVTWAEAICLKLFLNLPGQAIDLVLLEKKAEEVSFRKASAAMMIGTTLRVFIAWIWAGSLISVLVNFHPFPERVISLLLLGTAAMIWGLVWAFVPELLPGEKNLQQTCRVLFGETPAVVTPEVAPAQKERGQVQGMAPQRP